ncbi:MAG TPA: hypothetical protein VN883_06970 [Myxococcales bacterium]|jgi:hypothetical protein|nr:hypothetical protein [Myxococcales bacterium]
MRSPLSSQERAVYSRSFAAALLALALAMGGQVLFGGEDASDSCPADLTPHMQRALAKLAPELPLVQLGQYLGRALVSRLHSDCRAS